jgi:hypothetical protein
MLHMHLSAIIVHCAPGTNQYRPLLCAAAIWCSYIIGFVFLCAFRGIETWAHNVQARHKQAAEHGWDRPAQQRQRGEGTAQDAAGAREHSHLSRGLSRRLSSGTSLPLPTKEAGIKASEGGSKGLSDGAVKQPAAEESDGTSTVGGGISGLLLSLEPFYIAKHVQVS